MWKVTHTHNTNTHNTSGVLQCIVWEWVFCWTRSCGWSAQDVVDDGEGVNGCSVLTATWIASFLKPLSESRAPHPHHYQLCRALCWLCWLSLSSTKCQNAKVKTTETWQLFTGWWAKNISEVLWKMNREKLLLTTCPQWWKWSHLDFSPFRFSSSPLFGQQKPQKWPNEDLWTHFGGRAASKWFKKPTYHVIGFIYTRCIKLRIRMRVWKKIFSVIYYVQIICIIIFLLKITKLTFILLNFELGLRVLHNKVNHGNYDLPNNSAHSVYPIAQSKVNKK